MAFGGIVRKVDSLGRFVIPKEVRDVLGINPADNLEFWVTDDGQIVLKPYVPTSACVLCEKVKRLVVYNNKRVCLDCVAKLKIKVENNQDVYTPKFDE